MNIHKAIDALKKHTEEEWRIHAEIMNDARVDIKRLVKKHWRDTKEIHKSFFQDIKKAVRDKK